MSDTASQAKKPSPENLLYRSRMEICRILQALAQEHSSISANIKHGHPFSSYVLAVDPVAGHFVIAFCVHKLINAMLLDLPSVEFTATNRQGLHYTFEATSPEETRIDGEHAIQFSLPKSLLMHNRREFPRFPVPPEVSLRCIADEAGYIPFESHINDISQDGLGCLIYDPDINLETGTLLHGCRIILPNGDAVITDLELRYAAKVTLPDGSLANAAGFRFCQKSDELAKLTNQFIQDLDKK
jgi:c-di-GMP-binding flagellar brake protein YcgR